MARMTEKTIEAMQRQALAEQRIAALEDELARLCAKLADNEQRIARLEAGGHDAGLD